MKSFTFAVMLLAQRVDEALRFERLKSRSNPQRLTSLGKRKRKLGARLRRSLSGPLVVGR